MTRAARRYYRTILLAVGAMAVLVWAAMDQFGISRQEILQLFVGTLLAALAIIVFAALFALLWMGLRAILRRGDKD